MPRSPAALGREFARAATRTPARTAAAVIAAVAGLLVVGLATEVFPYNSLNHDEGVYLQQAAMLLDGRLTLQPPVEGVFRPWFFVADGDSLYPKYAPVPAAMFALGGLVGAYRLALGVVAAVVVALLYATVAEAFDRPTGAVAAAVLVATPLFLVQASVFLPYVPTLAWLLLFAWAYLRADRTGDRRWAALAGLGAGVGFFARPFTAVLFASPFMVHAIWTLRRDGRPALDRQAVTAAVGLGGVSLALAYNAAMTGSPTVFPYEAFAPRDGIGFGRRVLLGHDVVYTPGLALETARVALTRYVFRWSVAAPLGVLVAAVGVGLVLVRGRSADSRRLALAGLAAAIPAGQLYFWGTYNAIGDLAEPGLGLFGHLGPYYHLGLVVPTAAFGAHALVSGWRRLRPRLATIDPRRVRVAAVVGLLLAATLVGVTAVAAVDDTLEPNSEVTDAYEEAYAPVEAASFEDALVFLPPAYGSWLNHPFQYLRNDPDFEGDVVYAQDRRVFDTLDAYPDRTLYRYSYRGDWLPVGGDAVAPRLERLDRVAADGVTLDLTAGLPERTRASTIRVDTEAGTRTTVAATPVDGRLRLRAVVRDGSLTLRGVSLDDPISVPVGQRDTVSVAAFVDTGGLDSFDYRVEVPIARDDGTVRAVSPRRRVCSDARSCDDGAAFVPGQHSDGVWVETELSAAGGDDD